MQQTWKMWKVKNPVNVVYGCPPISWSKNWPHCITIWLISSSAVVLDVLIILFEIFLALGNLCLLAIIIYILSFLKGANLILVSCHIPHKSRVNCREYKECANSQLLGIFSKQTWHKVLLSSYFMVKKYEIVVIFYQIWWTKM